MSDKKTYGIASRGPNKGKLTPCEAKDPEKCSFHEHNSHKKLTEEEFQEQSERLSRKAAEQRRNRMTKKDKLPAAGSAAQFKGSPTGLNSMLDKLDTLEDKDIDKIHDSYFDGVRPLKNWKNNGNIYTYKVSQSRLDPMVPADEYVTSFKNDDGDTMYLSIQRDEKGEIMSSMETVIINGATTTVDIPATQSNKSGYESIWDKVVKNPAPEGMRRELVTIPGGRLAGLDTPVALKNGKPQPPFPVSL